MINNDSIHVKLTGHCISTTNIYAIIKIHSKIFVKYFFQKERIRTYKQLLIFLQINLKYGKKCTS